VRINKLLGSILALAMVIMSCPAHADILKNLKIGGQIDMQATSANNTSDFNAGNYDRLGDVQSRLMLNGGFDLLDDAHAMVTLSKNDSAGGEHTGGPQGNNPFFNQSGGKGVVVDQAYVKIDKIGGQVDTTFGRQFYGEAGDIVAYFGPSVKPLYGLPVSFIDAARVDWSNDMVGIMGLWGRGNVAPNQIGAVENGTDVRNITAMIKGNAMWNASAYVWQQTSAGGDTRSGKNDYLWIAGFKAKFMAGPAYVKGEYAKNFGRNRTGFGGGEPSHYTGAAWKIDAGANIDAPAVSINPWGQFAWGSQSFAAINPDYRPGGIYGYFGANGAAPLGGALTNPFNGSSASPESDSISNRIIWGAGIKATPGAGKFSAGIAYWDYRYRNTPQGAGSLGGFAFNRHIGSEGDLDLMWKHSDNISFLASAGQFWPGGNIADVIKNGGGANGKHGISPATMFSFGANLKF
jgi:hypothetical protein